MRADPDEMLQKIEGLQSELAGMQPKVGAGEIDAAQALEKTIAGVQLLANVVEGLVRDYGRRF